MMKPDEILHVLDQCCDEFTFPMLDNGYLYLAATRLALFRSSDDWAMVIEVFGFSPRAGDPDIHIHTFASRLHDRDTPDDYVSREAYDNYIQLHPHNDSRFVFPISSGAWQDPESDAISEEARDVVLRGQPIQIPPIDEYRRHQIELADPPKVQVFEFCRYLAAVHREKALATPDERRISVLPDMKQILQLEEWHHPNVVEESDRPSGSETFRQLAKVLVSEDVQVYQPTLPPNTHWRNWPEGGTL
jgi:hypothetical protein